MPEPRKAALARVRDPANGEVIDEALALWFPGPNSETGEDMAELQLHGGRAVIAAVLGALGAHRGLAAGGGGRVHPPRVRERPARSHRGRRARRSDRRRDARRSGGRRYRQLKGLLGDRAESWRARLIEALALVEARIDFSDEADVPEDLVGPALKIARRAARRDRGGARRRRARGERLRDGLVVAIAGPPNAGKSTLLNRIARREVAIVSPVPGRRGT